MKFPFVFLRIRSCGYILLYAHEVFSSFNALLIVRSSKPQIMNKLHVILSFSSIFFIVSLSRCKIIVNEDNRDLTVDCVNHVLKNIYRPGDLVLVSGNIFKLHYPVINYNWTRTLTNFRSVKSDIAVIRLDENGDLNRIISKMSEEQFFNPRAKFVIISKDLSLDLLAVSSKYYLTNVIFMKTVNESFQSIYTYEPYQNQNSSYVPTSFKYLTQCKNGIPRAFTFFEKHRGPKAWKNSTLNIIYYVIPPYFQCPTCEDGIEADLLDIVSKKLGFKLNYVVQKDFMYWGSKINGTYTHILQKLFQR